MFLYCTVVTCALRFALLRVLAGTIFENIVCVLRCTYQGTPTLAESTVVISPTVCLQRYNSELGTEKMVVDHHEKLSDPKKRNEVQK